MVGGERTVDVHIRRLRAKLGSCAEGIVTVRGVGYRLDDQTGVHVVVESE
jgi:DNA-binding response OmpR family regulator